MSNTPAARRYRRAWQARLELSLCLQEATEPARQTWLRSAISAADAELAAAQTAYAREAPWAFGMLPDEGRD